MRKFKLREVLEILYEPISFDLDEDDRFIIREYLYPKSKEELSEEEKELLQKIGRKYKRGIEEDLCLSE